uniref:Odorant receptor n=1 Tax=Megaselia scalaris TaxID=36166 RepID=T1GQC4_MEGSC
MSEMGRSLAGETLSTKRNLQQESRKSPYKDLCLTLFIKEFLSYDQNTNLIRELSKIIQSHNDLITLTQDFAHLFTIIILGHFVTSGFVLCVSCLNFILVESYLLKAIYLFYNAVVITQLFIFCSGGASIVDTSTEFAETAYFTEWYKCDIRVRKFIWLIIMRSQKPIELDVPFFAPSLPLFTAICRTAGSYIALLKTFI